MTSWYKNILSSIKEDSSWKASILIPSTIWHKQSYIIGTNSNNIHSSASDVTTPSDNEVNEYDIIQQRG